MKFVYAPEGATPKEWDFAPRQMSSTDAIDIERLTSMRFGDWELAARDGSMLAIKALLFVHLRREVQTLTWSALEFKPADCSFRLDDDEQRNILAWLEDKAAEGPLSDADAAALAVMREAYPTDQAAAVEPDGGGAVDPTQRPTGPEPSTQSEPDRSGSA